MFCPQCGQKQLSDGVRFCSSCGFRLEAVTQLLATNGQAHWQPPLPPGPRPPSPRRNGVKQGVMLIALGTLIVPILGILNFPDEMLGLAAVICFIGGFLRMLYALFFEDSAAAAPQPPAPAYVPPAVPPNYFGARGNDAALPPAQAQPTPAYRPRRFDTGELVNPPQSVIDHTTRLLDKQTDEPPAK